MALKLTTTKTENLCPSLRWTSMVILPIWTSWPIVRKSTVLPRIFRIQMYGWQMKTMKVFIGQLYHCTILKESSIAANVQGITRKIIVIEVTKMVWIRSTNKWRKSVRIYQTKINMAAINEVTEGNNNNGSSNSRVNIVKLSAVTQEGRMLWIKIKKTTSSKLSRSLPLSMMSGRTLK